MSEPPLLESATVITCCLEVPLEDFGHLPEELGCSLHRSEGQLTLQAESPGCAMHFRLEGQQARLDRLEISNDHEGQFFQDVVCLMLQLYSGDLEAELNWSSSGTSPQRVEVRGGETSHPWATLPLPQLDLPHSQVDRWLDDARRAWAEYQRLTGKTGPEA